jgi:solute carrier family 30 (zinc transporter), member 2
MINCPENSCNSSNNELRAATTKKTLRKLYLAIVLCTIFMIIELVGGYLANSLAIISDAVHLLTGKSKYLTYFIYRSRYCWAADKYSSDHYFKKICKFKIHFWFSKSSNFRCFGLCGVCLAHDSIFGS